MFHIFMGYIVRVHLLQYLKTRGSLWSFEGDDNEPNLNTSEASW